MKLSNMNGDCDVWTEGRHDFQPETDTILSLDDIERARNEQTSQPNNANGNVPYHDSWGELDFDEELPQIRKLTSKGSSRHIQHNRAGRNEGSNNKRSGPPVAELASLKGSYNSRSLRRHQSDDEMDYFVALAPDEVVRNSRCKTRQSPPRERKERSRSLDRDFPAPVPFMVAKTQTPISEWDLTNSSTSGDEASISVPGDVTSKGRRRPRLSLHREHLIGSLAWFSFHTPKCVLEDLTSHELENCTDIMKKPRKGSSPRQLARKLAGPKNDDTSEDDDEDDDDDVSSLSDDETRSDDFSRSDKKSKPQSDGKLTTHILRSKQMPQQTLKMPYSTTKECALVFVDISGFTKLSTILDEESLSKVSQI
jgi:hypothetical protein